VTVRMQTTQGTFARREDEQASSCEDYRPKDVVAALIKRLAHRNANVQLYTLEVSG
jgi:hypothetical protein